MAEVMPINFPLPSESAVASYNYTDMAEGTGVTVFYLVGATGDNILTSQTVYADDIENATADTDLTSDFVKLMDTDYDLSAFNAPRTIKGTGLVNLTYYEKVVGDESTNFYFNIIVKKYDGSTETTIGTATTPTLSGAGNTTYYNLGLFPISLTQTHFAIGDILRVTVEGYAKDINYISGGRDHVILGIGQDPMNRDGGIITPSTNNEMITQSKIYIPFKLDL
jgi:hypothetical protein